MTRSRCALAKDPAQRFGRRRDFISALRSDSRRAAASSRRDAQHRGAAVREREPRSRQRVSERRHHRRADRRARQGGRHSRRVADVGVRAQGQAAGRARDRRAARLRRSCSRAPCGARAISCASPRSSRPPDDGHLLWSQRYDRRMDDAFAIQDEIARTIVNTLRATSFADLVAPPRVDTRRTLRAYSLYLKGRFEWNRRTQEGVAAGIRYFEQAIAEDPTYALAYTGLADCYALHVDYRSVPVDEGFEAAKAYARKAIELDDSLAEAHASLAWCLFIYDWDWDEARSASSAARSSSTRVMHRRISGTRSCSPRRARSARRSWRRTRRWSSTPARCRRAASLGMELLLRAAVRPGALPPRARDRDESERRGDVPHPRPNAGARRAVWTRRCACCAKRSRCPMRARTRGRRSATRWRGRGRTTKRGRSSPSSRRSAATGIRLACRVRDDLHRTRRCRSGAGLGGARAGRPARVARVPNVNPLLDPMRGHPRSRAREADAAACAAALPIRLTLPSCGPDRERQRNPLPTRPCVPTSSDAQQLIRPVVEGHRLGSRDRADVLFSLVLMGLACAAGTAFAGGGLRRGGGHPLWRCIPPPLPSLTAVP